jgi:DNA-binding NarL/FixJ family response regulator
VCAISANAKALVTNLKLRVLLADDHVLVREGLRRLIDEQPDMEVVGEAGDGPDAMRLCETLIPDVALVDVSMPIWDGVKTAQALRSASPQTKIVSVTRHDDESFLKRIFAAGAMGYVLKQSASAHLTSAIRAVARGEQYIDPSIRRVAEVATPPAAPPLDLPSAPAEPLTDIETEVLRLAATSHSRREIGESLSVDPVTVSEVKARAMAKIGLQTRIQLIEYASRHGWLGPPEE